jgi:hypothetical protein
VEQVGIAIDHHRPLRDEARHAQPFLAVGMSGHEISRPARHRGAIDRSNASPPNPREIAAPAHHTTR